MITLTSSHNSARLAWWRGARQAGRQARWHSSSWPSPRCLPALPLERRSIFSLLPLSLCGSCRQKKAATVDREVVRSRLGLNRSVHSDQSETVPESDAKDKLCTRRLSEKRCPYLTPRPLSSSSLSETACSLRPFLPQQTERPSNQSVCVSVCFRRQ